MKEQTGQPPVKATAPAAGRSPDGTERLGGAVWPEVVRLYPELRTIAQSMMRGPSNARTLQVTALVNEAALHMMKAEGRVIESPKHFLAYAAVVMRRILIDHARRRRLNDEYVASCPEIDQDVERLERSIGHSLEALGAALDRLRGVNPQAAEMVDYRVILELSGEDTAEAMGLSSRTADRKWQFIRKWLKQELGHDA